MKKFFSFLVAAIAGVTFMTSCGGSDDNNNMLALLMQQAGLTNTFSVPVAGAAYVNEALPSNPSGPAIGTVNYNSQGLAGGSNYVSITSQRALSNILLGIGGQNGYYTIPAASVLQSSTRAEESYTYLIPLQYTVTFANEHDMMITGQLLDGSYTQAYTAHVTYVVTATGALSINLTFDQAKDVDLHLYMPDGTCYFYGHRGYSAIGQEVSDEDPNSVIILDHDSNAGCTIDNLNNENIVVPLNLIQKGEYKVVVNMYSNCSPREKATNWNIVARYKGNLITPTTGANPANGTYAADCGNGDMTQVMKFFINEGLTPQQSEAMKGILRPLPLDIMSSMKLEEASWK